jgi:hypothetical protein
VESADTEPGLTRWCGSRKPCFRRDLGVCARRSSQVTSAQTNLRSSASEEASELLRDPLTVTDRNINIVRSLAGRTGREARKLGVQVSAKDSHP